MTSCYVIAAAGGVTVGSFLAVLVAYLRGRRELERLRSVDRWAHRREP